MTIIGCDVDGVLVDFLSGYRVILEQADGNPKAAWATVARSPTFWTTLPPVAGIEASVQALNDPRIDLVYFITRRHGVRVWDQTAAWLRQHGVLCPAVIVVQEDHQKADLARALRCTAFLDDSMSVGKHFRRNERFVLVHNPDQPPQQVLSGQIRAASVSEGLRQVLGPSPGSLAPVD